MAINKMGIVFLAAGQSRRFGSDKLMAEMPDNRPVIAHSLAPFLAFSESHNLDICVITRPDNKPLIEYLDKKSIPYSLALDAHKGMGNTIAHGVKTHPKWQGWLIALADMPNITLELLNELFRIISKNKDVIVRPAYSVNNKTVPAHPVYFPSSYFSSLEGLTGDKGAKHIIKDQILLTHFKNALIQEEIMADVDTKDKLSILTKN